MRSQQLLRFRRTTILVWHLVKDLPKLPPRLHTRVLGILVVARVFHRFLMPFDCGRIVNNRSQIIIKSWRAAWRVWLEVSWPRLSSLSDLSGRSCSSNGWSSSQASTISQRVVAHALHRAIHSDSSIGARVAVRRSRQHFPFSVLRGIGELRVIDEGEFLLACQFSPLLFAVSKDMRLALNPWGKGRTVIATDNALNRCMWDMLMPICVVISARNIIILCYG